MAQIDLKFATFKVIDGFAAAGLVNSPGNYVAGILTIAVTGLTSAVANGDTFQISGESGSPVHTVTAHVETAGVTTQVTFTTAIATGGVTNSSSVTFTKTGAMNGAVLAGVTTIIVDGFVGAVSDGDTFLIAAETGAPTHTITSHLETTGNTTSITFTTVVGTGGAADNAVITLTRAGATVSGAAGYGAGI